MTAIPILQFVRPHAEQRWCATDVSDEAGAKWMQLEKLGVRLTAECIFSSVHVCIEHELLGDYTMILAPNGPGLQEAIAKMILDTDENALKTWIENDGDENE